MTDANSPQSHSCGKQLNGVSSRSENRRVVFIKRPGENNPPTVDCFQCEDCEMPTLSDLEDGHCIVRTMYLSIDPVLRCRMNTRTKIDYLAAFEVGQLIDGMEGVGIVEAPAQSCNFKEGDLVTSVGRLWPWSKFFVADQQDLAKVNLPPSYSPSTVLSCVGISGMSALLAIRKKGKVEKNCSQTFVVSAAAGSIGSLAGQIARIEGCSKIIGICGSETKCNMLMSELGFDIAINYKSESVLDRLIVCAPEGIDIYFDNVGGFISDAVIAHMNRLGRVIVCGQISVYNTDLPYLPPLPVKTAKIIAEKEIARESFIALSYKDDIDATVAQLSHWLQESKLKHKETIYEGLNKAPVAFIDMMAGKNVGKTMVKID